MIAVPKDGWSTYASPVTTIKSGRPVSSSGVTGKKGMAFVLLGKKFFSV
jgi:hypothetical protein